MTIGSTLPPAERRVLRQDILFGLRSGILSGEIPAGTRLLEIPLATELGVSRGPVREALRQLEQEGLVEFFPHRGAVVVGVGESEIETIYAIRALLEERAFAKACRRIDDAELDALAETVEKMIAAGEEGDAAAVAEYDMRFHGRVVELSGFSYLRRLWTSIDGVVRLRAARDAERPEMADATSAREWLSEPSIEHRVLVEALRSRRPQTAAKAARAHIARALERLHDEDQR
jgi:DNA-binding GntR family transcriptional regulator